MPENKQIMLTFMIKYFKYLFEFGFEGRIILGLIECHFFKLDGQSEEPGFIGT